MKKLYILLVTFTLACLLVSCGQEISYQGFENIESLSITTGEDNLEILISNRFRLTRLENILKEAKKYQGGSGTVAYNDYIVQINCNNDQAEKMVFLFPDEDIKESVLFSPFDNEDDIFYIPGNFSEDLREIFFQYGPSPEFKEVYIIQEGDIDNPSNYIKDKSKLNSLKKIIETSIIEDMTPNDNYIHYRIRLGYINGEDQEDIFTFFVNENGRSIYLEKDGQEGLSFKIDDDLTKVFKSIVFER